MSYKFFTIVAVLALTFSTIVIADEPTYIDPLDSLDNKGEMMVWVNIAAQEYGVKPKFMKCLIRHENRAWNPELQSLVVSNGKREDSWGLSQIHLPSHPSITREEATDPKFAIEFMASEISEGNAWQWSTLKYCKHLQ